MFVLNFFLYIYQVSSTIRARLHGVTCFQTEELNLKNLYQSKTKMQTARRPIASSNNIATRNRKFRDHKWAASCENRICTFAKTKPQKQLCSKCTTNALPISGVGLQVLSTLGSSRPLQHHNTAAWQTYLQIYSRTKVKHHLNFFPK